MELTIVVIFPFYVICDNGTKKPAVINRKRFPEVIAVGDVVIIKPITRKKGGK